MRTKHKVKIDELSMINLSMDNYVLAFEGSNYPSYHAYIGKYIKLPILPTHMGGDVFGKVIKMQHEELRVRFFTDAGDVVFGDNAMPSAYTF